MCSELGVKGTDWELDHLNLNPGSTTYLLCVLGYSGSPCDLHFRIVRWESWESLSQGVVLRFKGDNAHEDFAAHKSLINTNYCNDQVPGACWEYRQEEAYP